MLPRKTLLVLSFCMVIFLILVCFFAFVRYTATVTIENKTYVTEVADTNYLLEKGLSGHVPLLDAEGMLFVFKTPDKYGFWMKDMLFPIDIIWISSDFKVTGIETSLSPETYPKIFYPEAESLYVLEIRAGEADRHQIKIGDSVQIVKKWL